MSAVLNTVEDIVNDALVRLGSHKRVGSIYDGTDMARAALDIYGQTRDDMLRSFPWGFAERNLTLTLQKTAPVGGYTPPTYWSSTYPILPWVYQYSYPGDCLQIRALRCSAPIIPVFDPAPVNFRVANDNSYSPSQKVILCNLQNAILVYTGQVTDPSVWEPKFTEGLIAGLARRLAPMMGSLDAEKIEGADEGASTQSAEMTVG